jgi:hypothetical protein
MGLSRTCSSSSSSSNIHISYAADTSAAPTPWFLALIIKANRDMMCRWSA